MNHRSHALGWLLRNKMQATTKNTETWTRFGSGKYEITPERLPTFRTMLARDYTESNPNDFVELKTDPVYKLFCDLDFKADCSGDVDDKEALSSILTDAFVEEYIFVIQSTVVALFDPTSCDLIVAWAEPKLVDNNQKVKRGVHMHWPDLPTNTAYAKFVHASILRNVESWGQFDAIQGLNSHAEIIDNIMWVRRTGLRPIGGSKKGKPNPGDVYHVRGAWGGNMQRDPELLADLKADVEFMYEQTSVSAHDMDPMIPEGYTEDPAETGGRQRKRAKTTPSSRRAAGHEVPDGAAQMLVEFMARQLEEFAPFQNEAQVQVVKEGILRVTCINLRYCRNICKEHNSNRVFYTVKRKDKNRFIIEQECYNDKPQAEGGCGGAKPVLVCGRVPENITNACNLTKSSFPSGASASASASAPQHARAEEEQEHERELGGEGEGETEGVRGDDKQREWSFTFCLRRLKGKLNGTYGRGPMI